MKKFFSFLLVVVLIACSKDPVIYTLTATANPAEGGSVSPSSQQYDSGDVATVRATASSEYVFQSWSGSASGSSPSTTVTMDSDKAVVANFVKKKYALTVNTEGEGSVTEKVIKAGVATDYTSGTVVELTAVPEGEWLFVEWTGDLTGSENPKEITIDKAKTVTAVFVKKQYPLTIEIEGEGTVSEKVIKQGLATDYNSGTIVELTAEPTGDWEFVEWSGDLTSTENTKQITIDGPKTVKVKFMRYFDYMQPSYFLFESNFRFNPNKLAKESGNYRDGDGYKGGISYADFNIDGYVDVLYAKSNGTDNRQPLELYINDGDNINFTYDEDLISNNIGGKGVRKSIVGDYNGDKKPDVFFADHGVKPQGAPDYLFALQSMLISSENGYEFKILSQIQKEFNHGACSGDFDNDGDLDIFTSTGHFLINDGNANFTLDDEIFNSQTGGIFTVEMIDINNDGYLDLITGGHSFESGDMKGPTIYYGNGVNFTDERSYILKDISSWGVVVDIDFYDLNNDGYKEIILNRTGGESGNWDLFYVGWRIQIFENITGTDFKDETEKYIDNYQDRNGRWTVWYRIDDIDNDGFIELFDDDPNHNDSGVDLFWNWNGTKFIKQ